MEQYKTSRRLVNLGGRSYLLGAIVVGDLVLSQSNTDPRNDVGIWTRNTRGDWWCLLATVQLPILGIYVDVDLV